MRDTQRPNAPTIILDVPFEIYLKGREEPVHFLGTYAIPAEILSEAQDAKLNDVMQVVIQHILGTIDTVGAHRLILSDRRESKFVVLTDSIASISVLAPDEATILKALEQL